MGYKYSSNDLSWCNIKRSMQLFHEFGGLRIYSHLVCIIICLHDNQIMVNNFLELKQIIIRIIVKELNSPHPISVTSGNSLWYESRWSWMRTMSLCTSHLKIISNVGPHVLKGIEEFGSTHEGQMRIMLKVI